MTDWTEIKDKEFPDAAFLQVSVALAVHLTDVKPGDLMAWRPGIETRDPWGDETMEPTTIIRTIIRVEETDLLPSFDYETPGPYFRVVFHDEIEGKPVDRPYVTPASVINVMRVVHEQF